MPYEKKLLEQRDLDNLLEILQEHCFKVSTKNCWTTEHEMAWLLGYRAVYTLLFYSGIRCTEAVGDAGLTWKVLTPHGRSLLMAGKLPKYKVWKGYDESEGIWQWKSRPAHQGIQHEDVTIRDNTIFIKSAPLKGGTRSSPIELSMNLPHIKYVEYQWKKTQPYESVFPMRHSQLWQTLKELAGISSHTFRYSRATSFAGNESADLRSMMQWFGWKRSATADFYIQQARSGTKMRNILEEESLIQE